MENITRTVYGSHVQTCLFFGKPVTFKDNSTLNQKFSILHDTLPSTTDRIALGGLVWGNRGHRMEAGADGIPRNQIVQHRATDAGLYGQMPFALREINNDLTAAQRANFALRRQESHNDTLYWAYYMRRLDATGLTPNMYYTEVTSGTGGEPVENITAFVPTAANLSPTPPAISNTGTNVISADYVSSRAHLTIKLTEADVAEMLNVAKVIYGDESYAIISELGLCTFANKQINAPSYGGGTFSFSEAIGVQIAAHVATYSSLMFNNTGAEIEMEVGANEPLFAIGDHYGQFTLQAQ